MLKQRILSVPANYPLVGAVVLFLATTLTAAYPVGRAPLVASEMSQSRGSSFEEGMLSCNMLAGYASCTRGDTPCNICGKGPQPAMYYDIVNFGTDIDPGNPQGGRCSTIYNGTCTLSGLFFICDTSQPGGGNTNNPCPLPPGPAPLEF